MEIKKPQLHQSHLQMLYRCGEKFKRVVLDGEREPSTTPLVVGTTAHSSIANNLNHKINKGHLLTREAVQDFTRDDFVKTWQGSQIVLNEEEISQGLSKTRDILQDQTIQLVTEHHYVIAPIIKPVSVERKWVLEAEGFDYDMAGTIDVDEGVGIRDTKTKKTNLSQAEVEKSEQYTFYALAKFMIDGFLPEYVAQDNLIKPGKNTPARAISYYSTREKEDFIILYRRFSQANKIIKVGLFTPANPSDWWCSKDFCGFAANGSCPYFNSKTRKSINRVPIKTEDQDGNQNSIINRLTATLASEDK